LDADADIRVGDRVVTSGTGGIYPRDLVIGYVTEVIPDEFSRTLTATVRPAATLTDLDRVMIITSYETVAE
jgi:rod shape-determining protein MreC